MSRSGFRMSIEFAMLDGRKACVPGYEDWSGGHTTFKFGPFKLRLTGPSSSTFDELDEPYDRDKWVSCMVDEFKSDDRMLRYVFEQLFDQAKAHCGEHHSDLRETLRKKVV